MESILLRKAIETDRPVLGICRGLQFINAALGGTLYQDLPSQHPSDVCHRQRAPYDVPVHEVTVDPSSPLYGCLGVGRLPVNSCHHQAVKDPADGLKAMAVSPEDLQRFCGFHAFRRVSGEKRTEGTRGPGVLPESAPNAFRKAARVKRGTAGFHRAAVRRRGREPAEQAGSGPWNRKDDRMFTEDMIGPCGLDCSLCARALTKNDPCPGCGGPDENKPEFCSKKCGIILCGQRKRNGWRFCDVCPDFPCADVMEKENRYTSKYPVHESPLQNLRDIRSMGMEAFLAAERERWCCRECGSPVCVQTGICSGCGRQAGKPSA